MMENLEVLEVKNKTVGIKQSTKALNQDKVKTLFIAKDADNNLIEHMTQIAKEKNVEVIGVDSMKKLGKACGIDVGAAVAAILK